MIHLMILKMRNQRTFEQIEGADIIIWVVDVSVPYLFMN